MIPLSNSHFWVNNKKMKRSTSTVLFGLLFLSTVLINCKKTELVIEDPVTNEQEEEIPNNPPNTFKIDSVLLKDTEVWLFWNTPTDPDGDKVTINIELNNSIVEANMTNTSVFIVDDLTPDTDYKLSVVALDSEKNTSRADTLIHTKKAAVNWAYQLNLDYNYYLLKKVIRTTDNGFLLLGVGGSSIYTHDQLSFIVKLNSDYSMSWKEEFDWDPFDPSYYELYYEMLVCPDNSILALKYSAVVKLNSSGELIWKVPIPEGKDYIGFKVAVRDEVSGDFFLVGITQSNYFLMRITDEGEVLWHKDGQEILSNNVVGIKVIENQLLLYGVTVEENNKFWILKTDKDGNKLEEKTYPNPYQVADILTGLSFQNDGSFLLYGAIGGNILSSGSYNTHSRITKIGLNGDQIWDIYPDLDFDGAYYCIWLNQSLNADQNLFLTSDDRGVSFYQVDQSGSILNMSRIPNYPSGMFLFIDDKGNYTYFNEEGWLININHDGYFRSEDLLIH